MSDEATREQPAPQDAEGPAIWDLVVADMRDRDRLGEARYGTRLRAGNGRDALVDAYQEALDQCVYLRQAIEQRRELEAEVARLRARLDEKEGGK